MLKQAARKVASSMGQKQSTDTNPNPDKVKQKILKEGMIGLISFFNTLSSKIAVEYMGKKYNLVELADKRDEPSTHTLKAEDQDGEYQVDIDTCDWFSDTQKVTFTEKEIKDAFVQFLETLFLGTGMDGNNDVCFDTTLQYLDETLEKHNKHQDWRKKWFNETGKKTCFKEDPNIDAHQFNTSIYKCAMTCLCVITMVNKSYYSKLLNEIQSSKYQNHKTLQDKTRYFFKPLNPYVTCIAMSNFSLDSSPGIDSVRDLYMTEDFFNLDFKSPSDLVIQFFLRYLIEFGDITRIKFCDNQQSRSVKCNNLLFIKKTDFKKYCSHNCKVKHQRFNNAEPKDQTRCRNRQNEYIRKWSEDIRIDYKKTPSYVWKEKCNSACNQKQIFPGGGKCLIIIQNNKELIKAIAAVKIK